MDSGRLRGAASGDKRLQREGEVRLRQSQLRRATPTTVDGSHQHRHQRLTVCTCSEPRVIDAGAGTHVQIGSDVVLMQNCLGRRIHDPDGQGKITQRAVALIRSLCGDADWLTNTGNLGLHRNGPAQTEAAVRRGTHAVCGLRAVQQAVLRIQEFLGDRVHTRRSTDQRLRCSKVHQGTR